MMEALSQAHTKSVALEATVIRADGTVEHLGVVSYWHRNPLKRALYRLRHRNVGKVRVVS